MPMKFQTRVVNALLANIPTAIFMSLLATWLGMKDAPIPPQAFTGAWLAASVKSMPLSYLIAVLIGIFLPLPKWAMGVLDGRGVTPRDGIKFSLGMTALINCVYVLIMSAVLSFVNVVIVNGAPIPAFLLSFAKSLIPCYLLSFVIMFFWTERAEAIARNLCHDPAPARGPQGGRPGQRGPQPGPQA